MEEVNLIVGVGSPTGDDRIGWEIATQLQQHPLRGWVIVSGKGPMDLLDLLANFSGMHIEPIGPGPSRGEIDQRRLSRLAICDAVASAEHSHGQLFCWHWPAADLARVPFRSSHQFSVVEALELADSLGLLPPRVTLWGIGIDPAAAMPGARAAISCDLQARLPRLLEELRMQLCPPP